MRKDVSSKGKITNAMSFVNKNKGDGFKCDKSATGQTVLVSATDRILHKNGKLGYRQS